MMRSDVSVLVVDDDEVDVMAVKRAFVSHSIANPLIVAQDGLDALAILRGNAALPLCKPYLILLDLNMPRMNGVEFLEELRADPSIRAAIVFVLTTSSSDEDRMAAYRQNIAGYILKSRVGNNFAAIITLLREFCNLVEMPT